VHRQSGVVRAFLLYICLRDLLAIQRDKMDGLKQVIYIVADKPSWYQFHQYLKTRYSPRYITTQ